MCAPGNPKTVTDFGHVQRSVGVVIQQLLEPGHNLPTPADNIHAALSRTGLLRVSAIARRDFVALFVSPVGWVVAGLFTFLVSGFGFIATVLAAQQATMDGVFGVLTNFLMVVLVPQLTMRVPAVESAQGTLELLLTSPVRAREVTAGTCAVLDPGRRAELAARLAAAGDQAAGGPADELGTAPGRDGLAPRR